MPEADIQIHTHILTVYICIYARYIACKRIYFLLYCFLPICSIFIGKLNINTDKSLCANKTNRELYII